MASQKFTISFSSELAARVREVAEGNVSAWLAEAAARRLRQLEAQAALREFEDENGEITEADLAEARAQWPA